MEKQILTRHNCNCDGRCGENCKCIKKSNNSPDTFKNIGAENKIIKNIPGINRKKETKYGKY